MENPLAWLFDAAPFITRDCCGAWGAALIWTYQLSNAGYALSYLRISASLASLWKQRHAVLPQHRILLGFAVFIALCGLTHACDVAVFYWPAYRFFTVISATGAIVSFGVALATPAAIRYLLSLRTHAEYDRLFTEKDAVVARLALESQARMIYQRRLQEHNADLKNEVAGLREQIIQLLHCRVTEADVTEMRERLHRILNTAKQA